MTIEIELKYQLTAQNVDKQKLVLVITTLLENEPVSFEMNHNQLLNDYFDNENLSLRKMDFGLRIRSKGAQYEQTIKTAGKVEAGLHQRPEYNVALSQRQLDLSLFPSSIWPEDINIKTLQQSLQVIFSTNFSRQTWLIQQGDNVIELALDSGEIYTTIGAPSIAINEIEIELVQGDAQTLFNLAEKLKAVVLMQPSNTSKAARGYALYHNEIAQAKAP